MGANKYLPRKCFAYLKAIFQLYIPYMPLYATNKFMVYLRLANCNFRHTKTQPKITFFLCSFNACQQLFLRRHIVVVVIVASNIFSWLAQLQHQQHLNKRRRLLYNIWAYNPKSMLWCCENLWNKLRAEQAVCKN